MHKQRGAIGLVLILAVVALAVGGYFLYQKFSFPYSMGLIPTPKEEAKNTFYTHGAESSLHKGAYESASLHEANDFGKKIDDYLANQG